MRHDHLDPAQPSASATDGRSKVRQRARAIVLQPSDRRSAPTRGRLVLLHGSRRKETIRLWNHLLSFERPARHGSGGAAAYLKTKTPGAELLVINSFEDSQLELELDGQKVSLTQSSQFPRAGEGTLTFHMAKPATFGLLVRVPKWVKGPPWTSNFKLTVNDQPNGSVSIGGYARVRPREWKDGDHVKLTYRLGPRLIVGHFGNTDRAALAWGPFVLAYDQAMNPGLPSASAIALVRESTELTIQPGPSLAFRGPVVGRKD